MNYEISTEPNTGIIIDIENYYLDVKIDNTVYLIDKSNNKKTHVNYSNVSKLILDSYEPVNVRGLLLVGSESESENLKDNEPKDEVTYRDMFITNVNEKRESIELFYSVLNLLGYAEDFKCGSKEDKLVYMQDVREFIDSFGLS